MPAGSGMAFVVMLHLPSGYRSLLGEVLAQWTPMPVVEATDGTPLQADHVYVPPPHTLVGLVDGRLRVEDPPEGGDRVFRPIDAFFDSLGAAMGDQAVGILLSGAGTDGALGLKAIKEAGGLAIVQGGGATPPEFGGMPAGAIATGSVDLIAPVGDIPGHLLRLKKTQAEVEERVGHEEAVEDARLAICNLLRNHLGHDFSGYRSQTFLRRVERRMAVTNATSLGMYIEQLKANPEEIRLLFRDLLIRVTSFFRDAETFNSLALKVVPGLFEGKGADANVRVWVPGCATGEEAYSLAILLKEHMDTLPASPRVQIFATDIDDLAISAARLGRYPRTLVDRAFTGAAGALFHLVARQLLRYPGDPRAVLVLRPQPGARSAVFCDEHGVVPEPADLHESGAAGTDHSGIPLFAAFRGHIAAGWIGIRGPACRAVRNHRQGRTDIPQA